MTLTDPWSPPSDHDVKGTPGMQDATASMTAVRIAGLLGLDGFIVLAAVEVGGELELLIETTADLVSVCRTGAGGIP